MKKSFPRNTVICIAHTNEDRGYIFNEYEDKLQNCYFSEELEDSILVDIGKAFLSFCKEYGRCQSKVYVDHDGKSLHVGWCFLKRDKYEDCNETYLMSIYFIFIDSRSG